jgi:hypothetical protein
MSLAYDMSAVRFFSLGRLGETGFSKKCAALPHMSCRGHKPRQAER